MWWGFRPSIAHQLSSIEKDHRDRTYGTKTPGAVEIASRVNGTRSLELLTKKFLKTVCDLNLNESLITAMILMSMVHFPNDGYWTQRVARSTSLIIPRIIRRIVIGIRAWFGRFWRSKFVSHWSPIIPSLNFKRPVNCELKLSIIR